MEYEALPPIPEVDFSKIKLERMVVKPDDAAVDEALENLAETAQNFEDRKKGSKAKDGDQVVMDFVGKVDGEPFEGGSAEDYPLVLGSNSFIPGFEEQLVGVKAGDEKAVTVNFPDAYQADHLAVRRSVIEQAAHHLEADDAAEERSGGQQAGDAAAVAGGEQFGPVHRQRRPGDLPAARGSSRRRCVAP